MGPEILRRFASEVTQLQDQYADESASLLESAADTLGPVVSDCYLF